MSDKVLLAKTEQPPPKGYIRVTPPAPWKMKTRFDVQPDNMCPCCWGTGEQRQVIPGKEPTLADPTVTKPRHCDCLMRRVVRHLERLNNKPAKAHAGSQAASKPEPMTEQTRAAIARLEAELEDMEGQREDAIGRLQLSVTEALEQTQAAQDRFDGVADAREAALDTAKDLGERANEYRRRADVVDETRKMLEELAATFARDLAPLQLQLDGYKRRQANLSADAARAAGRWDDRMKGPRARLERLRRRLALAEGELYVGLAAGADRVISSVGDHIQVGVDPAAPGADETVVVTICDDPMDQDRPIPFKVTQAGHDALAAVQTAGADDLPGEDSVTPETPRRYFTGSLVQVNEMGKARFLFLRGEGGETLQLYVKAENVTAFSLAKDLALGDVVGAYGPLFKTRKGKRALKVEELRFLDRPQPDEQRDEEQAAAGSTLDALPEADAMHGAADGFGGDDFGGQS